MESEHYFFDTEVFPNLFIICYKKQGEEQIHQLINPSPNAVAAFLKGKKLIGFNCRKYDNHLLYARQGGKSIEELYDLSQRIINQGQGYYGQAYNLSYTDVYDFSSDKKTLKKWEIQLGLKHQEAGLPWDQPVPEVLWQKVADYCANDVIATEATFKALSADFTARKILAKMAGYSVNSPTNTLTQKIIFGHNRSPQQEFNYRDLSKPDKDRPYFLGYKFDITDGKPHSYYKGIEVGEGGLVFAKPGIYKNVVSYDIASMHPSTIIAENLFGDEYTAKFKKLLDARLAVKHKEYDKAIQLLGPSVSGMKTDEEFSDLSKALKIAINSVYGLTCAKFENPFKDPRNVDNIVAKRGALFMIDLKEKIESLGGNIIHIKTDSLKIENPSPEIEKAVYDFGKQYGYNFEIENIYEKICLINDAVYIALRAENDPEAPGKWQATGERFAVPYVYKTLFSKEGLTLQDFSIQHSVKKGAIYINHGPAENPDLQFIGKTGLLTPVKSGGGSLVRDNPKGNGYAALKDTKGYLWQESDVVAVLGGKDIVDMSYFEKKKAEAIEKISELGDAEEFLKPLPSSKLTPEQGVPKKILENQKPLQQAIIKKSLELNEPSKCNEIIKSLDIAAALAIAQDIRSILNK